MAYCINSKCRQRENADGAETCTGCGSPLLIGDRFRLIAPLRPLDEPGHSEIFEVEDVQGKIQLLGDSHDPHPTKVLKVSKKYNAASVQLLKREAEALQTLHHPGLAKIAAEDGYFTVTLPQRRKPIHCLVMEKVPGTNLQALVEIQGAVKPHQAFTWLVQLLNILDYLHQHRHLHRDIKPSNIMLKPDGQLVVIDFGTVREVSQTVIARLMGKDVTGMGIFSPGYTAPEQVTGRTVPQSDLYAVGRTIVFLLTGIHPLDLDVDSRIGALLWRDHVQSLPQALADWLDFLMEPLFWKRPPNAAYVLSYLNQGLVEPPVRLSTLQVPLWLKLLNLGLFSVLLVTTLLWVQGHRENQQIDSQDDIIQLN